MFLHHSLKTVCCVYIPLWTAAERLCLLTEHWKLNILLRHNKLLYHEYYLLGHIVYILIY